MTDPATANLAWWNERASQHADTPMYRPWLDKLRAGEPALFPLERRLMGDVAGLDVLHLPCHIGHDTLSWALLGARVTGVDFSPVALAEAAALTEELGLQATWVEADAADLPMHLHGRFDRVVATYGAYGWMKDLDAWVQGIARCLRPGGRFVLVDGHPLFLSLELDEQGRPVITEPVMGGGAVRDERSGSYADPTMATTHNHHVGWCHGIGELAGAMLRAGLILQHLEEHDWCVWPGVPSMVPQAGGFVFPPPLHGTIPCMISFVAAKPS